MRVQCVYCVFTVCIQCVYNVVNPAAHLVPRKMFVKPSQSVCMGGLPFAFACVDKCVYIVCTVCLSVCVCAVCVYISICMSRELV